MFGIVKENYIKHNGLVPSAQHHATDISNPWNSKISFMKNPRDFFTSISLLTASKILFVKG